MRPDITYPMLVDFICRLTQEASYHPYNNTGYGNTSQQLREAADHVARMENAVLRMGVLIEEARRMVMHTGVNPNGTIKRTPKTNTLTVK